MNRFSIDFILFFQVSEEERVFPSIISYHLLSATFMHETACHTSCTTHLTRHPITHTLPYTALLHHTTNPTTHLDNGHLYHTTCSQNTTTNLNIHFITPCTHITLPNSRHHTLLCPSRFQSEIGRRNYLE